MPSLFRFRQVRPSILWSLLAFAVAPAAQAHVTLEQKEAVIGTSYKAVLLVPHGCAGAATTSIRVQIPEGLIGVKPMPKPGWTLSTTVGDYKQTYAYYHAPISKGVTEITWSGGRLPDDWYDEFIFRGYLARSLSPNTTLYIPVVQVCEGGATDRWIEIPAVDRKASDDRHPAPGLHLLPAK